MQWIPHHGGPCRGVLSCSRWFLFCFLLLHPCFLRCGPPMVLVG